MFSKILVPVDGSEHALEAARYGANLGKQYGIELVLINVSATYPHEFYNLARFSTDLTNELVEEIRATASKVLEQAKAEIETEGLTVSTDLVQGSPAEAIVEYAKKGNFDLIVMGNRGLGSLSSALLGSVSDRVIQTAHCPVLITRKK